MNGQSAPKTVTEPVTCKVQFGWIALGKDGLDNVSTKQPYPHDAINFWLRSNCLNHKNRSHGL